MKNMTLIFLIIVIIYFLYAYIKSRKDINKKNIYYKEEENNKIKQIYDKEIKEKNIYLNYVIAAAVSSVMGERPFRIKRIEIENSKKGEQSVWKIAGRQQSMLKL